MENEMGAYLRSVRREWARPCRAWKQREFQLDNKPAFMYLEWWDAEKTLFVRYLGLPLETAHHVITRSVRNFIHSSAAEELGVRCVRLGCVGGENMRESLRSFGWIIRNNRCEADYFAHRSPPLEDA